MEGCLLSNGVYYYIPEIADGDGRYSTDQLQFVLRVVEFV